MILEILRHTPVWVFVLFGVLVAAGLRLARPNRVSLTRLLVVPVAMASLSLWSLVQAFGAASPAIATWLAIVGAAVTAGLVSAPRTDVQYSTDDKSFAVPGSWLPLVLMMSIFFTRYAVAVLLAMQPAWRAVTAFEIAIGALYGVTSGAFAWRALGIGRVAARRPATRSTPIDASAVS